MITRELDFDKPVLVPIHHLSSLRPRLTITSLSPFVNLYPLVCTTIISPIETSTRICRGPIPGSPTIDLWKFLSRSGYTSGP